MRLILTRQFDDGTATHGSLFHNDDWLADTIEPTWRNNEARASCIPTGTYPIIPRTVGGYYNAYRKRWQHDFSLQLDNTGERKLILIHTGNRIYPPAPDKPKGDSLGCIIVGQRQGNIVVNSRDTYNSLYNTIKDAVQSNDCVISIETLGEAEDVGDRSDL